MSEAMQAEACPFCRGTGKLGMAFIRKANGGCEVANNLDCFDCKGSGRVAPGTNERREVGRRFADLRRAHDLSLREAARLLGIGAAELSGREHGREAAIPDEWFARIRALGTDPTP